MEEQLLNLLHQKLTNLINEKIQAFDDALSLENAKHGSRGFSCPNSFLINRKAEMMCDRIINLSKDAISILKDLSEKGIMAVDFNNSQVLKDTLVVAISKEKERLRSQLVINARYVEMFSGNIRMVDNSLTNAIKEIATEIDVIALTPIQRPIFTQNTVIANTITNAPIQQGGAHASMTQTVSYSLEDLNDMRQLLNVFDEHLDDLDLNESEKRKVMKQVGIIRLQLEDEPDSVIVKQAGRSLRNITEGAIGSLVATAVQPIIWSWAAPIIEKLFG